MDIREPPVQTAVPKGEALVVPGPPDEAATMRVELTGFAARRFPPMGSEDVRGAWRFEFALLG